MWNFEFGGVSKFLVVRTICLTYYHTCYGEFKQICGPQISEQITIINHPILPYEHPHPFTQLMFHFNFLEPPQATNDCPHQYGYFKVGDTQRCGQFMNCADGIGYVFDCPEGLAFNPESYRCDWPDQVPDCDAECKRIPTFPTLFPLN